jgi:hypothetical protein
MFFPQSRIRHRHMLHRLVGFDFDAFRFVGGDYTGRFPLQA